MQRPVEFRAWDVQAKKMRRVTAIMFVGDDVPLVLQEDSYNFAGELMQYTGLCDKNGTKVFEGDIVKYFFGTMGPYEEPSDFNDRLRTVEVACSSIGGGCFPFNHYNSEGQHCVMETVEIIGDIYTTPELIKGTNHVR